MQKNILPLKHLHSNTHKYQTNARKCFNRDAHTSGTHILFSYSCCWANERK